jgi:hypothetical protein
LLGQVVHADNTLNQRAKIKEQKYKLKIKKWDCSRHERRKSVKGEKSAKGGKRINQIAVRVLVLDIIKTVLYCYKDLSFGQ